MLGINELIFQQGLIAIMNLYQMPMKDLPWQLNTRITLRNLMTGVDFTVLYFKVGGV